jgi:O-antigen ligase
LFRKTTGLKKFFVIFALIVGMIGAYSVFDKMLDSSSYFQERVDDTMEGDSSGRDVIYEFFWNYYRNNTTPEEFLVGMGANATLDIFGQYAHNDWLEIAINQGLLGIVIYLLYWISFLRLLRKKNLPPDVKVALWMLFMIGFLKTLFSMSYREYTVYYSMVLGYCVAIANNNGCAVKKR